MVTKSGGKKPAHCMKLYFWAKVSLKILEFLAAWYVPSPNLMEIGQEGTKPGVETQHHVALQV